GMRHAEIITQDLGESLVKGNAYKCSFYVYVAESGSLCFNSTQTSWSDVGHNNWEDGFQSLDIYLAKSEIEYIPIEYILGDVCAPTWTDKEMTSSPLLVSSTPLNLIEYTPGTWNYIETFLTAPGDGLDWIGFELSTCFGYVLIDDIELTPVGISECQPP